MKLLVPSLVLMLWSFPVLAVAIPGVGGTTVAMPAPSNGSNLSEVNALGDEGDDDEPCVCRVIAGYLQGNGPFQCKLMCSGKGFYGSNVGEPDLKGMTNAVQCNDLYSKFIKKYPHIFTGCRFVKAKEPEPKTTGPVYD
jgi:hypothetical protein